MNPITWEKVLDAHGRPTPYAIRSACGRWQISKAGKESPVYSLWDNHKPADRTGYRSALRHFAARAYRGHASDALQAAKGYAETHQDQGNTVQ